MIQAQLLPELTGQPARAVLAGTAQLIIGQAQRQGQPGGRGRRPVRGKKAARFRLARVGIENLQRLGPGGVLGVVEIAQIEQRLLMYRAGSVPDILDHAPVAMLLAVFLAFGRA